MRIAHASLFEQSQYKMRNRDSPFLRVQQDAILPATSPALLHDLFVLASTGSVFSFQLKAAAFSKALTCGLGQATPKHN